ncbi:MAG: hypothetical protein OEY52_01580 [Gammaproteobacteria bacterium]|nr:hypothetical protein [Gammaproteobacteria bacterium]
MQLNTGHRVFIFTGALFVFLQAGMLSANEIAAFKFTGVDGNVAIQRHTDEQLQGEVGGSKTRYALTTNEEEFNFLTYSYIYHPNLLSMDLGGGVLLTQNKLETTSDRKEYDDDLYSVTARLKFLENKPYPVTLYYEQTTPSVSATYSERFVLENKKTGINAAINQPVLPFSMNLEAFEQKQEGSGSTQIINNRTEQVQWRAYRSLGKNGHGQLTYYVNRFHSESGIVGQAINERDIKSESASLDTSFDFGTTNQLSLTNLLSVYTQDNLPKREEFRWAPNLSWQHTEDTSSFYRIDYYDVTVEQHDTLTRSGAMGFRSNLTETVGVNGEIHGEKTDSKDFSNERTGLTGSLSYTYPFTSGKFSIAAGGEYSESDRKAPTNEIEKLAEPIRLGDVSQKSELAFHHVTTITSVIHADPDRRGVVILVEGVDYKIELPPGGIGPAYIWRLGTENLTSGESVLVDYKYKSGGTVTYSNTSGNLHTQLDFFNHFSIYSNYSESDSEVEQGFSSIPISSTKRNRYGARMDHPFLEDSLKIGLETYREYYEDEISPYSREQHDAYIQTSVFSSGQFRVAARRLIQDNLYTVEDVDIHRQSANLRLFPWPRSSLVFQISNEKDVGGSIPRRIKEKSITGQWRIRKLILSLDGRSVVETVGSFEREHNTLSARVNREF